MAKKAKTEAAPEMLTISAAEMERRIAEAAEKRAAEMRQAEKDAKAAKREARTTLGFKGIPITDEEHGRNLHARCVYVVSIGNGETAVIEGSAVKTATGCRVSLAIGAVFGVSGDTAAGDSIDAAAERLDRCVTAKMAAWPEMRAYLVKTYGETAGAYPFRAKPAKPAPAKPAPATT